ncbi:MAG: hypothetical protein AAGA76_13420 [Pseudomonadota bacterium]
MAEGHSYTVTTGDTRFQSRDVVRFSAANSSPVKSEGKRIFAPFAGFDGQALAGTGALVFEGELLELRN